MRTSLLLSPPFPTPISYHLQSSVNGQPGQPWAWLMHRAQKWICDEAVMWWAAYTRNKTCASTILQLPLRSRQHLRGEQPGCWMHVTAGTDPWHTLGLSNESFQTLRSSPLLVWCVYPHLGWGLFNLLHHCHFFHLVTPSPSFHPLQTALHPPALLLNVAFLSQSFF